jgi:hypothetical protein
MSLHIDLIDKGYFPVEIPPAFSTSTFASALGHLPTNLDTFAAKSSRCAFHSIPFHSIPRLQHHRRLLGIPNPLHQLKLVDAIERHWTHLEAHMAQSTLSMTRLEYVPSSDRGLQREFDFDSLDQPLDRWLTVKYPRVPFERYADDGVPRARMAVRPSSAQLLN